MKRSVIWVAATFFLASCAPTVSMLQVDVKQPAVLPLSIKDRHMAVFTPVYDSVTPTDSALLRHFAESFSNALSSEAKQGEGSVPLFSHYCGTQALGTLEDPTYTQDLALQTESDMLFMVDSVTVGDFVLVTSDKVADSEFKREMLGVPFFATIRVYDALNQSFVKYIPICDSVFWELILPTERTTIPIPASAFTDLLKTSTVIATNLARSFSSQWETQERVLFVNTKHAWKKAFSYAELFEWTKARDIWFSLLESENRKEVACAAYNLAVVCELEGRRDLANQWLDYAEKTYYLPEIDHYRAVLKDI